MIGLCGENAGSADAWKDHVTSAVAASAVRRDIQIFRRAIGPQIPCQAATIAEVVFCLKNTS
jgi:hypothetical protein